MRRKGYRLTRYADDWVITCSSAAEARAALGAASQVLKKLDVIINPQKTRIVHVRRGFEFLGYKIKRGSRPMRLTPDRIKSGIRPGALYAYPREKSINHFKDQVRRITQRKAPVSTQELIQQVNPVVRGWGHHYKRAHVRKLFNRLDRWLVQRIWSHRNGRWRCRGWQTLPGAKLYSEYGLVNLVELIPSIATLRNLRLRESWAQENCTPSLSSGARGVRPGCVDGDLIRRSTRPSQTSCLTKQFCQRIMKQNCNRG